MIQKMISLLNILFYYINFMWTHEVKFPTNTLTQLKLVIDSFMRHLSSSFLHSHFPQFDLEILANNKFSISWKWPNVIVYFRQPS